MPDPDATNHFEVSFFCEKEGAEFPWVSRFLPLAERILSEEDAAGNVNVILASDETVRKLNAEYRKLDKVTDVLSFEWHEEDLLGEIYIAEAQVKRQAPVYGNSYYQELKRVLVHGLLHLAGFDHIKVSDRKKMRAKEENILGTALYQEVSHES
ncbi:MAG: rRNA maturation RNase YbeY [Fibrobacter sp.]|jgi:probable rRNA maturation factor|nr:rRNA maturation RNase YbeY [Fibrobacter sp.]